MMCRKLLLVIVGSLLSVSAWAADPQEMAAQALAGNLTTTDAATVEATVREIQTLLESDPERSVGYLRRFWLRALQDARKFDLVEELSLRGILAMPERTGDVEFLQEARVRSLLARGKPQEALAQARALFNVAGMRSTERVLLLLAECLKAVHPNESAMLRQLAKEQKTGAATRPASASPTKDGTVLAITVDGAVYQKAIQQIISDDDRSQLAKGNLLLLSGRASDAKAVFEQMLDRTDSASLLPFHENIARAIRAEDGTIGRANGYLLSVPEDER